MSEILQMVRDDPEMQNLSKEEEATYIKDLVEYRESRKRGARISNSAAAADVRNKLDMFNTEVRSLPSSNYIFMLIAISLHS